MVFNALQNMAKGDRYAATGDPINAAIAYSTAGNLYSSAGDQTNAAIAYNNAGDRYVAAGDPTNAAIAYNNAGNQYSTLGFLTDAAIAYNNSGDQYSAAGDPYNAAIEYSKAATQIVVNPSCFNEGTKILCLNKSLQEEYLPIETLRRGDLVKSYKHGYRRIDLIGKNPMINDPKRWSACMYKMEKTEENGLLEDLIVTGAHFVLVDELQEHKEKNDKYFGGKTPKIDDKYLLLSAVSKDFVKLENTNLYTYYHLTLENNGNDDERFGIWGNGVLTEATSKKDFINHKYTLL